MLHVMVIHWTVSHVLMVLRLQAKFSYTCTCFHVVRICSYSRPTFVLRQFFQCSFCCSPNTYRVFSNTFRVFWIHVRVRMGCSRIRPSVLEYAVDVFRIRTGCSKIFIRSSWIRIMCFKIRSWCPRIVCRRCNLHDSRYWFRKKF